MQYQERYLDNGLSNGGGLKALVGWYDGLEALGDGD